MVQFLVDWIEFVFELNCQLIDYVVMKQIWGVFIGIGFDVYLKVVGVMQIVLIGVVISIGVELIVWQVYEFGYNVMFVVDVMIDFNVDVYVNSVEWLFLCFGEMGMMQDIVVLFDWCGV